MVKIRISGKKEEVNDTIEALTGMFDVLDVSDYYHNHGNSKTVRVYVDADVKKTENKE